MQNVISFVFLFVFLLSIITKQQPPGLENEASPSVLRAVVWGAWKTEQASWMRGETASGNLKKSKLLRLPWPAWLRTYTDIKICGSSDQFLSVSRLAG